MWKASSEAAKDFHFKMSSATGIRKQRVFCCHAVTGLMTWIQSCIAWEDWWNAPRSSCGPPTPIGSTATLGVLECLSLTATLQVCFSSKYTLSLPEVEKGPLRHLMAQLPDSFSFEVVTTLIIDTRRAAITHHSEQWVGLLGPRALPSSIRRWTGWLVTVSSRVWIVGSGIKQALQAGLWPLHAP